MKDITCEELRKRKQSGEDLTIIDVREPWEYEEYNMGAQNIPLSVFQQRVTELEPMRDHEIIIHCNTDNRSHVVQQYLERLGFSNVRKLVGGIVEWRRSA